jgi:cytoskeletal protein CcmA (bactofilin family)
MSFLRVLVEWKDIISQKLWKRTLDPLLGRYPVEVFFPEGVSFTGEVESDGVVRVEGDFRGNLQCPVAVLASNSRVTAGVQAQCLYIEGRCRGIFRVEMLYLAPQGDVEGEVHTETLYIEDGARMRGRLCVGGHKDSVQNREIPAAGP